MVLHHIRLLTQIKCRRMCLTCANHHFPNMRARRFARHCRPSCVRSFSNSFGKSLTRDGTAERAAHRASVVLPHLSIVLTLQNCKCVQLCLDGKQQYSEEWRDEGKTHVRIISSSLSVSYELSLSLFLALKSLTMGGFLEVRQKKYEFNILQNLLEGMKCIYACY